MSRSRIQESHSTPAVVLPLFGDRPEVIQEEDASLLRGIAAGDHGAFERLLQRHDGRYYRLAYRFTGRRAEAEDIVQEAFLKLWERPNLWQPDMKTAFTTWFYRVVVNMCLDHAKKKRPAELQDDSWVMDERDNHEEALIEREKQRLLETQIALLPERQRIALNLCFYEGLSNQEAADAMGLRLKALQALLMRAKSNLKESLRFMIGEEL